MRRLIYLWVVSFFSSTDCGASLTVIYDSGNTLPLTPYYKDGNFVQIKPDGSTENVPWERFKRTPFQVRFPIVSKTISVGVVKKRPVRIPHMQTPVFIVGADRKSRQWLSQHYQSLMGLNAVGLLTNVNSESDLANMQSLVPDLKLIPVVVDDIAKQLNIKHYPVLISKSYIEQ